MRSAAAAAAASKAPFASAVPAAMRVARLPAVAFLRGASSLASVSPSAASASPATVTSYDHLSFVEDVAATSPPEHLQCLLNILQARGETIISPGAKEGLVPLVIPLSKCPTGNLTSLLRWPTAPSGMEMPVVEVREHGVWLLAKDVDQYIHRLLVEAHTDESNNEDGDLWQVLDESARNLYRRGDFMESKIADVDAYLLKKVGLFPDVLERKVSRHLERGDQVSALITSEYYTRNQFPGFGRPFVFNAQTLLRVGQRKEAKDAARVALKLPWWTLGCSYQEVAEIAEWDDEQIEFIREKVSEEGKRDDLKKGKEPEQVALDEAAFLMDLASLDGSWDSIINRLVECYRNAGLNEIARFIEYRE